MNLQKPLLISVAGAALCIANAAAAETGDVATDGAISLVGTAIAPAGENAETLDALSAQSYDLAAAATTAPTATAVTTASGAVVNIAQYSTASAAPAREDSYTVVMNQDAFFGFYPTFNGLIPVGDNVDFSFYGILWTTPSFGNGGGNDLWTEFGVGAAFYTMDGNLILKPQIGLTNGALLSGGVRDNNDVPTGTGSNFADGVVPSLTVNYSDDSFEAEFYGGYYAALRNRNDPGALDFLHTWINAGAKVSDKFSLGAHYELLDNTRNEGGNGAVVYQWLGPYVQFKTSNGFFARFTAGADIEEGGDGDFYKLAAGFSF
ncbi:MAG: DUF6733 family protein [Erythrobacter sp.]|jgi:hypothetical protein|nr:DUF6733 family protein [Erythrobacter sp.]